MHTQHSRSQIQTTPAWITFSISRWIRGSGDMTGGNADLWNVNNLFTHDVISVKFIKKNRLHEVTVSLFTSVFCCVGQPVYGTTSLLHLQMWSLTAEIIRFFTAIQKAQAASNFILPKSEITDWHLSLWF